MRRLLLTRAPLLPAGHDGERDPYGLEDEAQGGQRPSRRQRESPGYLQEAVLL